MKSFGKKLCITAALSFIFLFACGCSDAEGTNKHKPITGIDSCFEENLGYTVSSRSVDIYFTSSAVSGDEGLIGDEYLYTPMIHEFPLERG